LKTAGMVGQKKMFSVKNNMGTIGGSSSINIKEPFQDDKNGNREVEPS
jgi:hypothetical protein